MSADFVMTDEPLNVKLELKVTCSCGRQVDAVLRFNRAVLVAVGDAKKFIASEVEALKNYTAAQPCCCSTVN